jgi:hypothetical protein
MQEDYEKGRRLGSGQVIGTDFREPLIGFPLGEASEGGLHFLKSFLR